MANEWLEYIRKFDNLLQEAFCSCARNAMQTLFNKLHGDGTLGPIPLIEIDINLSDGKV